MKRILSSLMTAMIFSGVLMLSSSCSNSRTDSEIQLDITKKLADDDDAKGIDASVSEGVVTLSGECKSEECIRDCVDEVKEIKGVKDVKNNIRVSSLPGADAPVAVSADPILTAAVNEVIQGYSSVKAEVKEGVVTLRGEIQRTELQDLMQKLNNLQVKKIDNQLVVK